MQCLFSSDCERVNVCVCVYCTVCEHQRVKHCVHAFLFDTGSECS